MDFDVRYRDFVCKHTYSPKPDLSAAHFKEHYHTSYELLYFVSGDAQFYVRHTRYNIRPGSLLVAKPGEYHNILFLSEAPYERYVLRMSPNLVFPHIQKQLAMIQSVYYIDNTCLSEEFRRLDQHVASVHPTLVNEVCMGMSVVILSYLLSSQKLAQRADYVNSTSQTILEYIDAHLGTIHTVADIANALHMSKSTLYANFSQQLDTPIMTYVRTQKCIMAKHLLDNGSAPMDVAERLGFSHYSSFYRDYKAVFHAPPSQGMQREKTTTQASNNN